MPPQLRRAPALLQLRLCYSLTLAHTAAPTPLLLLVAASLAIVLTAAVPLKDGVRESSRSGYMQNATWRAKRDSWTVHRAGSSCRHWQ